MDVNTPRTNLNKVCKCLFAGGTGEAPVHSMHSYVIFEQLQFLKAFLTQKTWVGAAVCVHQQVVFQGRVAYEALAADVAGKSVGVTTMNSQMLFQFVFVPEGFSTVSAFERTKALPDKKVLECGILR